MGQAVVHFEIEGMDLAVLRSFYSSLFGWSLDGDGEYLLVSRAENTNAEGLGIDGAVSAVPEVPSPTWRGPSRADGYAGHVTIYVEVPDVDAALRRAESLGGTRMMGPDDVPGGPRIGKFRDPEGQLIGLVSPPAR